MLAPTLRLRQQTMTRPAETRATLMNGGVDRAETMNGSAEARGTERNSYERILYHAAGDGSNGRHHVGLNQIVIPRAVRWL